MLGLSDGRKGSLSDSMAAWQKIRKSQEFKALISGGPAMAMMVLKQGVEQISSIAQWPWVVRNCEPGCQAGCEHAYELGEWTLGKDSRSWGGAG